jgi:hypothetical protein
LDLLDRLSSRMCLVAALSASAVAVPASCAGAQTITLTGPLQGEPPIARPGSLDHIALGITTGIAASAGALEPGPANQLGEGNLAYALPTLEVGLATRGRNTFRASVPIASTIYAVGKHRSLFLGADFLFERRTTPHAIVLFGGGGGGVSFLNPPGGPMRAALRFCLSLGGTTYISLGEGRQFDPGITIRPWVEVPLLGSVHTPGVGWALLGLFDYRFPRRSAK